MLYTNWLIYFVLNKSFVVGGYNSGGGDMITQEDTIFVSGMSPNITEEDIEQHFGAIGVIKVICKRWFKKCECTLCSTDK